MWFVYKFVNISYTNTRCFFSFLLTYLWTQYKNKNSPMNVRCCLLSLGSVARGSSVSETLCCVYFTSIQARLSSSYRFNWYMCMWFGYRMRVDAWVRWRKIARRTSHTIHTHSILFSAVVSQCVRTKWIVFIWIIYVNFIDVRCAQYLMLSESTIYLCSTLSI